MVANWTDRLRFYSERGIWTDEKLGYLLDSSAGRWPDREFVSFEGTRLSYQVFARWVAHVAGDMHRRGVEPGDRIVLQMVNSLEILALQFAAWRIGAVCVPVVPVYRAREMRTILTETRPRAIALSRMAGSRDLLEEYKLLAGELGDTISVRYLVGGSEAGWSSVPSIDDNGEELPDNLPEPADARECCAILYTSGTTARPKGAMLTSRSLLSHAASFRLRQGLNASMVTLAASPLAHVAGLATAVINPMTVGGRTVVLPRWDPEAAVRTIESERVTHFATVVTFLQDIVECHERGLGDGHRLQVVACGGAPVSPELIRRADALGIRAFGQFGMTEVTNVALGGPDDPLDRRMHYCGRVIFGTEVQAVDEDRNPLPAGRSGELRIRSPHMMLGYLDPAATEDGMDADGWFYTGDVGSVDGEGWLRIHGRIKDIINRGGEKFSAADIEHALCTHADVTEAAVVGSPHPRFGEVVAAFLRLKPGAQWPGPDPILNHLEAQRLSRSKFPVVWRIVDDLPRSATGKVQKQILRDALAGDDVG